MKGKAVFTASEALQIKKLIAEKVIASPEKQKRIRAKIRKLGFYFSDFETHKEGYSLIDFNNLINSGRIKVRGSESFFTKSEERKPANRSKALMDSLPETSKQTDNIASILVNLRHNQFDPIKDIETKISDSPGNYIICLREKANLPKTSIKPIMISFEGFRVVYTGIAGSSLRTRDFRQHFKGNNAGRSTLRKSIGVLFRFKQIARDKNPITGKTKFCDKDELWLTKWMETNLKMFFLPTPNFKKIEKILITYFNPPLNLKDNNNEINADFRVFLSNLRTQKIR